MKQVGDVLGLLSDIGADIFAVVIDVDKLLERPTRSAPLHSPLHSPKLHSLDDIDVVLEVDDHILRSRM